MKESDSYPEINISKIPVGGGVAGIIFSVGSILIFLLGVPVLWYFFALALALGVGFALIPRVTDR